MNNNKLTHCSKCFQAFESREASFYYNKRQKRYYTWCKDCHQQMVAARKRAKKARQRPLSSDPLEDKFIKLRHRLLMRHKRKQWDGDVVTTSELLKLHEAQASKCHYTGLEYSLDEHGPLYMSVDRVDSSVGYTKDNVVLCCWFVNCAKNEWSIEQMKQLWKYLPTTE